MFVWERELRVLCQWRHIARLPVLSLLGLLLTVGMTLEARAATDPYGDPIVGYQLYHNTPGGQSCSAGACHGTDPTKNQNKVQAGADNPAAIQTAIDEDQGGMGRYQGILTSANLGDIAAYIAHPDQGQGPDGSVSPSAKTFPSTAVGAVSAASTFTFKNIGTASLTVSGIVSSRSEFVVTGGTCAAGTLLAVNASCTVVADFEPKAAGTITGTISINSNAANSPSVISLTGTANGSPGTLSLSPTTLAFGDQSVGTSSAAQTINVTNTGAGTVTFSTMTLGGLNPADFTRGGSCVVGTPIAANGGACTITFVFAPLATGARSATLSLASDATNSFQSISITGNGLGAAIASANPASLNFGSVVVDAQSPTQTVTVRNTGTLSMTLNAITTTGTQFSAVGGTCTTGTIVAASGSCTVLMAFQPATTGAASDTLSIANTAPGSPLTVALSGNGIAATPNISISPATLSFSTVVGSSSSVQSATVANTGTAALSLSSIALSGADAGDYVIDGSSTCTTGQSVAPNTSCKVAVQFTPATTGSRPAQLVITSNDTQHSPSTIALAGTGTSSPQEQLSVDQVTLVFPAQSSGTVSAPQTVTVSNTGSAAATLSSVKLGGLQQRQFAIDNSSTCTTGSTLAVAASCTVLIHFEPTASSGTIAATLNITGTTKSTSSATVGLSGTAAPPAAPIVTLSPTTLDLGGGSIGIATAAQTVTLTNSGSASLSITSLAVTPSQFAMTNDCPSSLAAAASCTLSVTFTATDTGTLSGTLTVTSNASTSPDTVTLSGTGVPAAAPQLIWVPASTLSFPTTSVGMPTAAQYLTVINVGAAPATISQISIAGDAATDFSIDASTTCPSSGALDIGSECQIGVVFSPSVAGSRTANLNVTSDAAGFAAATLNGIGSAPAYPTMTLAPSVIVLVPDAQNVLQPQALVIGNDGAGILEVTAITASSSLKLLDSTAGSSGGTCSALPIEVGPGNSCTLMVAAATGGNISGTIVVTSNDPSANNTVTVQGQPLSNVGAGGCSIGRPGQPADPLWALMVFGALAALAWRRRSPPRKDALRVRQSNQ